MKLIIRLLTVLSIITGFMVFAYSTSELIEDKIDAVTYTIIVIVVIIGISLMVYLWDFFNNKIF